MFEYHSSINRSFTFSALSWSKIFILLYLLHKCLNDEKIDEVRIDNDFI